MEESCPDQYVTENYLLHKYSLQDCSIINTDSKSYSDIVKEHLEHNPTVEVQKSLVPIKKKVMTAHSVSCEWSLEAS